jgi:hypothetical protein
MMMDEDKTKAHTALGGRMCHCIECQMERPDIPDEPPDVDNAIRGALKTGLMAAVVIFTTALLIALGIAAL